MLSSLRYQPKGSSQLSRIPESMSIALNSHIKAVNAIQWSATHGTKLQKTCSLSFGGSNGLIRLWDIRVGKIAQEYVRGLGPILDIDFSIDGRHFISSSDISRSNISKNSIIVWDVLRQVPLSNQVYVEAYTRIRYHPFHPFVVAQSNGNYIANFSASPPFRLDNTRDMTNMEFLDFPSNTTSA